MLQVVNPAFTVPWPRRSCLFIGEFIKVSKKNKINKTHEAEINISASPHTVKAHAVCLFALIEQQYVR